MENQLTWACVHPWAEQGYNVTLHMLPLRIRPRVFSILCTLTFLCVQFNSNVRLQRGQRPIEIMGFWCYSMLLTAIKPWDNQHDSIVITVLQDHDMTFNTYSFPQMFQVQYLTLRNFRSLLFSERHKEKYNLLSFY